MYYYNIYGLNIKSNVMIDFLIEEKNCETVDVEIELALGGLPHFEKNEMVLVSVGEYLFKISDTALYNIRANKIECCAVDFNSFVSTVFNIPFSVLLLLRGNLLIHACALRTKKGLILLSGEKGIGKSTLSAALCRLELFSFFADDTVRMDRNNIGYRAHKYMKLYLPVIDAMGLEHNGKTNIVGKYYVEVNDEKDKTSVSKRSIYAILYLNRGKHVQLEKINDIGYIFKRSIVGLEFLHVNLLETLISSKFEFESLYRLIVPDSLEEILQNTEIIGDYICKI